MLPTYMYMTNVIIITSSRVTKINTITSILYMASYTCKFRVPLLSVLWSKFKLFFLVPIPATISVQVMQQNELFLLPTNEITPTHHVTSKYPIHSACPADQDKQHLDHGLMAGCMCQEAGDPSSHNHFMN